MGHDLHTLRVCGVGGLGFRVEGLGFRAQGLGKRVSGLRIQGSGFGAKGAGFQGFRLCEFRMYRVFV